METHYEIVKELEQQLSSTTPCQLVQGVLDDEGHAGFYTLSEYLTDLFEETYKGREWDGDWIDTLYEFYKENLYGKVGGK